MKILISGTPGTGKTSVAEALLRRLDNYALIDLNNFAKEHNCIVGRDEERGSEIVDEVKLCSEVRKLDGNYVLEGHLAHLCEGNIVFVLRCDPGILRKRLSERLWPEEKIQENLDAEIMQVVLEEAKERHKHVFEVDTSDSVGVSVELILDILDI